MKLDWTYCDLFLLVSVYAVIRFGLEIADGKAMT